jgi:hypothetical protein
MGYASRLNPRAQESTVERRLRRMLALFADRQTYEQWLAARGVSDQQRAHLERYLQQALQAHGSV